MSAHAKSVDRFGRNALVKREDSADGRSRLGHEADMLCLAKHPGVVEILDFVDDGAAELTTAWVDARCADELGSIDLREVAGLVAAVAHTLADLHQLGIVHGRLTADHVLVLGDGRPVLCGLSRGTATALAGGQPDSPSGQLDPDVDVAALGRLLSRLVGPTRPSPIPERRRRWRPDTDCRAALLTLADVASHDDSARRPSAATFASDVLALVPDARLPTRHAASVPPAAPLACAVEDAAVDGRAHHPSDPEASVDEPAVATTFDGPPTLRRRAPGALAVARPAPDRPWSPARKVAAVAAILLAVGAVVLALGGRDGAGGRATPATVVTTTASPPTRHRSPAAVPTPPPTSAPSTPAAASPACAGSRGPDVDGDGCADAVSISQGVVTTPRHRYVVGGPTDQVVVADWTCDGRATPALLRSATGEVFLFPGWAQPGQAITVRAAATARPGSELTADDPDHDGCAALTLHEPGRPDRVLTGVDHP